VTFGARMQRRIDLMTSLAATLAEGAGEDAAALCDCLLAEDRTALEGADTRSCLNNDGTPIQPCLTADRRTTGFRIVCDPGADRPDTEARFAATRNAVRQALDRTSASALAVLCETTIDSLIPACPERRAVYRNGFAWLAASPGRPGLALYCELAPQALDADWLAVRNWLTRVLPDGAPAAAIVDRLSQFCVAASAGIEGVTPESARAKIYFRLKEPTALSELGVHLLAAEPMTRFIRMAMGSREVDLDGLVMSVSFNTKTGELADAKADLCGHCLTHGAPHWIEILRGICDSFGLRALDLGPVAAGSDLEIAFVGMGLTADLSPRLNVYLKPAPITGPPADSEMRDALSDAIEFLRAAQSDEGAWWDYRLPVGSSDQWVSAYVGLALAEADRLATFPEARRAALAAAYWLRERRTYAAGWGYNGVTGPDSDTTGLAVALCDVLDLPVAEADRRFLAERWRAAEGIATFDGPNAWGVGHWDVTPVGYLGLNSQDRERLASAFCDALHANRMPTGFWRSYWWRNPYYSTFNTLDVLDALGFEEPAGLVESQAALIVDNPFDLACYIGIEFLRNPVDPRIGLHVRALLNWQSRHGSWAGSANLRVTDDSCYAPWDEPSGTYYADERGLLTTATAIRVLSRLLSGRAQNSESGDACISSGIDLCAHQS
jgi:hypothetical protein